MDRKKEFVEIIDKNKGLLYKVAGFYTNNLHDREDLFQEIIYQLWKSFGSFKNNSGIGTWMYRVAMNTAVYFQKKSNHRLPVQSLRQENLEYPDSAEEKTEEQLNSLLDRIQELNLLERGIVMLYLEGKSYTEISELIGISVTNVGTRLSRIREKLKHQLSKT